MQDFGTKADNSPPPGGQLSAAEFNNLATENENAVLHSGQALSGASDTQLAQSLFLHGVKSASFQDSGAANAYVATPVSGASGVLLPAAYTNLAGSVITFKASNANSGASTLNIGQTTGTLLGSKPIRTQADTALLSGAIVAGQYIQVVYNAAFDSGNGAWELLPWAANSSKFGSSVHGLLGSNNPGTPNTQFDFAATEVILRDATTGATIRLPSGTITNNILTAGPAVNGRDQAGAFTNNSWIHFWFISNGSTLATISSASSTTPTLPAGYSYAAYAHAVFLGVGTLTKGVIRGSWFEHETPIGVVNNGNATVLTSIPLTTTIPPNALQFELYSPNLALTALGSGAYNLQCNIVISGVAIAVQFGMQGTGAANAVTGVAGAIKRLQNINQNFAYQLVVGAGVGFIVTIAITGYSVPNGGE